MRENSEWIKRRKDFLKNIQEFKENNDRIKVTTQILYMHNAVHESLIGWSNWLNGWVAYELNKKINVEDKDVVSLTDAELKAVHGKFKEFAMKYIEFDVKMTELIMKKIQKNQKLQKSKPNNPIFEISQALKDMIV
jgi:hypothetical protein